MMFHSNTLPPVRKRPRPEGFDVQHHQEVKFATVTLFIVERRMGCSRRSFLTSLARSKGFSVDDVLRYVPQVPEV